MRKVKFKLTLGFSKYTSFSFHELRYNEEISTAHNATAKYIRDNVKDCKVLDVKLVRDKEVINELR